MADIPQSISLSGFHIYKFQQFITGKNGRKLAGKKRKNMIPEMKQFVFVIQTDADDLKGISMQKRCRILVREGGKMIPGRIIFQVAGSSGADDRIVCIVGLSIDTGSGCFFKDGSTDIMGKSQLMKISACGKIMDHAAIIDRGHHTGQMKSHLIAEIFQGTEGPSGT